MNTQSSLRNVIALAALLSSLNGSPVLGASPALTIVAGEHFPHRTIGPVTVGWTFTVANPVKVTSLGILDADANGLAEAHQVAIWNAVSGVSVVSGIVGSGEAGVLVDGFRYGNVTETELAPGSYVIGAFYMLNSMDYHLLDVESMATEPSLAYGQGRYEPNPTFRLPGAVQTSGRGILGPNFQILSESPATIVIPPQDAFAYVGDPVTLQVIAVGAPPLAYQWRHDGVDLAGATEFTLTLPGVTLADAGDYDVVVSNAFGSPAISDPARLTVSFLQVAHFTGIILLGQPGQVFRIDATSDIAAPDWMPLTNVTLESTSATWIDLASRTNKMRLYRGVLLP